LSRASSPPSTAPSRFDQIGIVRALLLGYRLSLLGKPLVFLLVDYVFEVLNNPPDLVVRVVELY